MISKNSAARWSDSSTTTLIARRLSRGLNGSRHFVENPPVPLDRIYFMLNLDMVGRLRQNTVWVQGAGTATELPDVIGPLFVRSDLNVVTEAHVAGSDLVSFVDNETVVVGKHFPV